MTTTDMKMTDARRRGLAAIALKGRGRRSNTTIIRQGLVYWQTIRTLHQHGLIEPEGDESPIVAANRVFTDAGPQLAAELGLELKAAE